MLRSRSEKGLAAAFAVAFAGLMLAAAYAPPTILLVVPVALVGLLVIVTWGVQQEARAYVLATAAFLITSDGPRGIQLRELIYGLYFLTFLMVHIGARVLVTPRRLFRTTADAALFFFWAWSTLSCSWALLYGATFAKVFSEWIGVTMLLFYFPTRELVRTHRRGGAIVMGVISFLALGIAIRNFVNYRQIIVEASVAWHLGVARVTANEGILVAGALVVLVLAAHAERRRVRLAFAGAFVMLFLALVMTQSRAYWIDFLVGATICPFLLRGAARRRFVVLGATGMFGLVGVAVLVFPEVITGIAAALLDRFLSLGSAVQQDISLRGRFYEARAVLEKVAQNPVLGHGLAVPFRFYEIILDATFTRTFVHNGYVGLIYKAGLIGMLPLLTAWGMFIAQGLRALRRRTDVRAAAIAGTIFLIAQLFSNSTGVGFYTDDRNLMTALAMGLCAGALARTEDAEDRPDGRVTR